MEYKGGVASLSGWLQSDQHRGLALLRQWSAALESYASLQLPAEKEPAEEKDEAAEGESEGVTGELTCEHGT